MAYERVEISSPLGDLTVNATLHAGATDGDGWRRQHGETVDADEFDLPHAEGVEHVYLRSNVQWLSEDDEGIDVEEMGWTGDYLLGTGIYSTQEEIAVGDSDP